MKRANLWEILNVFIGTEYPISAVDDENRTFTHSINYSNLFQSADNSRNMK